MRSFCKVTEEISQNNTSEGAEIRMGSGKTVAIKSNQTINMVSANTFTITYSKTK